MSSVAVRSAPQAAGRRAAARVAAPVDETSALMSSVLLMVAIVCLWMAAQMLFLSDLSQDRAQTLLYRDFRSQLASAAAPVGPVVEPGAPVALISIPGISMQQVVGEGTASGDLVAGPGHRRDTVLPGQQGISLVYGRGATYGAPFARITELPKGAPIKVVSAQGTLTFSVIGVRRAGDPLPAPPAAGTARLTLVTAEGAGRLGRLQARDAVYVDAVARKAFPAPAGRPAAVPESEKALAGDTGALPLLALCLGSLVAVTLGVTAARQRWSVAVVWVVASPLVIALAWLTTDTVMRLLPNLM